jgi:hypothetical protein
MIEQLIAANLKSAVRRAGSPPSNPLECLEVDDVAPTSIAAKAGVKVGDLLVRIEDMPATRVDLDSMLATDDHYDYTFYSPSSASSLRLRASGAPIGMNLTPSTETIKEQFRTEPGDWGDLLTLWYRGAWDALERAAAPFVPRGVLGGLRGLFGKAPKRNTPALVMLGATLCETGRQKEGVKLIREYQDNYVRDWTMDFAGLASYYLGREAWELGDQDTALQLFEEACADNYCDRIADGIEELTGERPVAADESSLEGQEFPLDYDLPDDRGKRRISLASSLSAMNDRQLLVVCLLGDYRTNGPYFGLMRSYHRWAVHFPAHFAPMHVITENAKLGSSHSEAIEHWLGAEKAARQAGIPLFVLDDADGLVGGAIDPPGSPHALIVDRHGKVLFGGIFDEVDMWNCFAKVLG